MKKINRILRQNLLHPFMLLSFASVVLAGDQHTLETVSQVNLSRYVGTWYEIARLPNWFQDQCIGNVTADYRQLDNGNDVVLHVVPVSGYRTGTW